MKKLNKNILVNLDKFKHWLLENNKPGLQGKKIIYKSRKGDKAIATYFCSKNPVVLIYINRNYHSSYSLVNKKWKQIE